MSHILHKIDHTKNVCLLYPLFLAFYRSRQELLLEAIPHFAPTFLLSILYFLFDTSGLYMGTERKLCGLW